MLVFIAGFIVGGILGLIGMAILVCGSNADDRTKIIELNEQIKEWKEVVEIGAK